MSARYSAGNCSTWRIEGGGVKGIKGLGAFAGDVGWDRRVGAVDIATEPRTIDAIAALPAGHSDKWSCRGGCVGGDRPVSSEVVINSLEERSATPQT